MSTYSTALLWLFSVPGSEVFRAGGLGLLSQGGAGSGGSRASDAELYGAPVTQITPVRGRGVCAPGAYPLALPSPPESHRHLLSPQAHPGPHSSPRPGCPLTGAVCLTLTGGAPHRPCCRCQPASVSPKRSQSFGPSLKCSLGVSFVGSTLGSQCRRPGSTTWLAPLE